MILIDAVFLNSGGGIVLLNEIIHLLYPYRNQVIYLVDNRLIGKIDDGVNMYYCKPSLIAREIFVLSMVRKFDIRLCLANIGPFFKYGKINILYLHNVLYLNNLIRKSSFIKYIIFKFTLQRCAKVLVQTSDVAKKFKIYSGSLPCDIECEVVPIFSDVIYHNKHIQKKSNFTKFVYIAHAAEYKDHELLFSAFQRHFNERPRDELHVTISSNKSLEKKIMEMQDKSIRIYNHGSVSNESALSLINNCDVVVHPSRYESFGFGLLEAYRCQKPLIAPNLDYVKAIVTPSIYFNSGSILSLTEALYAASTTKLSAPEFLIKDRRDLLISNLNLC